MSNNENDRLSGVPENDASKPMNSKREVEQSPDEKTGQDFRGFPVREDVMDQQTGSHRADAELENMGTGPNATGVSQRYETGGQTGSTQTGTEESGSPDGKNEEIGLPHNVSNEDLDGSNKVPGTDIDEAAEKGSLNP